VGGLKYSRLDMQNTKRSKKSQALRDDKGGVEQLTGTLWQRCQISRLFHEDAQGAQVINLSTLPRSPEGTNPPDAAKSTTRLAVGSSLAPDWKAPRRSWCNGCLYATGLA
jgi:hypothetical protein